MNMRHTTLDEIGNPDAEPGSRDWSLWVALECKLQLTKLDTYVRGVKQWIEILTEHKAWESLGYASFELMCMKHMEVDISVVEAVQLAKAGTVASAIAAQVERARADKEDGKGLPDHGGDRTKPKDQIDSIKLNQEQVDNIKLLSGTGGTSTEYTLARLARDDHNDLLDAIAGGEISVNAAAIQAGYRKIKTPLEQLRHWWTKASARNGKNQMMTEQDKQTSGRVGANDSRVAFSDRQGYQRGT